MGTPVRNLLQWVWTQGAAPLLLNAGQRMKTLLVEDSRFKKIPLPLVVHRSTLLLFKSVLTAGKDALVWVTIMF
eukprot:TCALIF_04735-PA protein Name:"Protein of unknown function" AED:0.31 eAED:0.33 QI:0/0/0/1/0/0/2/0/73